MKKLISVLLAVLMLAALGSTAFAEAKVELTELPFKDCGITMYVPEDVFNTEGFIMPSPMGEIEYGSKVYGVDCSYLSMTEEEYETAVENIDSLSDEEILFIQDSVKTLFTVFAVGGGKDFSEIAKVFAKYDVELDKDCATEIGKAEDVTFYRYEEEETPFPEGTDPAYIEEFEALKVIFDQSITDAEYYVPEDEYAGLVGKVLSFETTDIDGKPVKSEDLFGASDITMLNVWASWCGPCIGELPELEEINGRIKADHCAVVGLLHDGDDPDAVETAKEIMKEAGVTYTVILVPENFDDLVEITAFPTTFFVDSTGKIVGSPVVGAQVDVYEQALKTFLTSDKAA